MRGSVRHSGRIRLEGRLPAGDRVAVSEPPKTVVRPGVLVLPKNATKTTLSRNGVTQSN